MKKKKFNILLIVYCICIVFFSNHLYAGKWTSESLRLISNDSLTNLQKLYNSKHLDTNKVLIFIESGRRVSTRNMDSALSYFDQARIMSQKINFERGVELCKLNISLIEISRSNYEQSIPRVLSSINYFKNKNDITNYNRALILYAYTMTGYQPDTALHFYKVALKSFEDSGIDNRNYIATLASIMEINELKNNHKDNIEILHRMKSVSIKNKDTLFIIAPLIQLAYTHFMLDNMDSGNFYLTQVEQLKNHIDNHVLKFHYHKTIGYKKYLYGDLEGANREYLYSYNFSEKLGNPKIIMPLLKSIIDNYESLKMYDSANVFWQKYYDISKKFYYNNNEAKIGLILANKNIKEANQFLKIEREKNDLIQKNNKYTIIIFSLSLILMAIALYHYINRNKGLIVAKELAEKNLLLSGLNYDLTKKESELSGQLNERKRIARELHDGLGINLVTLKLYVENAINDNPSALTVLSAIRNKISALSNEIRMISHNITPPEFDKENYCEIIKHLIQSYNVVLGKDAIKYSIHGGNFLNEIDLLKKVNIYRILQESLNNIHKHSNASEINVVVIATKESIDVIVEDNGIGFDINSTTNFSGINNLKNRAKEIDASFHISSKKNRGTEIALKINMN